MLDFTEEFLRSAASWQAFKRGQELQRSGAVSQVKSNSSGWQGVVKGGRRPMRVRVVVRSATDLTVHCSCPENQSTGAVCACAVATGLAAMGKSAVVATSSPAEPENQEGAGIDVVAWEIYLPASWKRALAAERLSARILPCGKSEISAADERLCEWLNTWKLGTGKPHALALQGGQLCGFLRCLEGHPRLHVDDGDGPVSVGVGARLALAELEREEGNVRLVAKSHGDWLRLGNSFWQVSDASLEMLGNDPVPERQRGVLSRLIEGGSCQVPLLDFVRDANDWKDWCRLPVDSWLDHLAVRPAPHQFQLALDGSAIQLRATATVRYRGLDPWPVGVAGLSELPSMEGDTCWQRDEYREGEAIQSLVSAGFVLSDPAESRWTITGEDDVAGFLGGALPVLRQSWEIKESSAVLRLAQSTAVVSPKIDIRGSGEDWLSFSVEYRTDDGESLDPREVRRLTQGAQVTTKRGKICRLAGGQAQAWQSLLADLDADQENGNYVVDARAGAVVEELAKGEGSVSAEWESGDFDSFLGDLRPYQKRGVSWLHDRTSRFRGAILADDMGLGKTVQTIAWAERLFARNPDGVILVLATTSLLGNWAAEWGKFAPDRPVRILHGAEREKVRETLGQGEVWITSHGTVVRDLAWYLRQEFLALVVDEASLLRNPDTDQAKAVRKLQAGCKVALTGTPIENSISDLWSLFSWVQPGWLGSRARFRDQFEKASKSDGGEREVALQHLRMKTSPFILRRTKEVVAPELPSKVVIQEFCDLLPEQAKLYAALVREGRKETDSALLENSQGRARMAVLTTLLRLRQVCCDPAIVGSDRLNQKFEKIESSKKVRLIELLKEAIEGNHKVLVFSQFRKQLLEIEKSIKLNNWSSFRLDGQTSNRAKLVDQFQSVDGPPIFLISLKAGGYGLNLTAADIVIHMDPWWNPAAEDQATDRAHRIGQLRPVTVYRLLTRGTVEEAVMRLQEKKRALAGVIDEDGGGDAGGWSMEDLRGLIE